MKLKYVKVQNDNIDTAYNIQKSLWPDYPDYNNFIDKVNNYSKTNVDFIVYLENTPVGITGIYVEDIDDKSLWLDWYGVIPEYRRKGIGKQILLDTIEYCKNLNNYDYLRIDTTYYEGRPAILLYDKMMTFKESYTIEDTENTNNNWIIYTYSLHGKKELWNNRYLGLTDYYESLSK